MKPHLAAVVILAMASSIAPAFGQREFALLLPEGVKVTWENSKAYREATPTRERICLNGLWRWQPADARAGQLPVGGWGYFKVPGSWPGITDYMQKDSQTVFAYPDWKDQKFGSINAAWYQREFTVPGEWAGRQLALSVEYLNSYAVVFVDGKKAGEIRFPQVNWI
jgi:beta-galactosidase/beta-glucuronidase